MILDDRVDEKNSGRKAPGNRLVGSPYSGCRVLATFFTSSLNSKSVAQKPSGGTPANYAGFGIQFVAAILLFAYAGSWIDGVAGTRPLFLVIGVFLGAGGTFYSMYRRVMADPATKGTKGKSR